MVLPYAAATEIQHTISILFTGHVLKVASSHKVIKYYLRHINTQFNAFVIGLSIKIFNRNYSHDCP